MTSNLDHQRNGHKPTERPLPTVAAPARPVSPVVVSVVVPTRNEAEGIERLLAQLGTDVTTPAEIIIVDDSDDGTAYQVRKSRVRSRSPIVRLVHRTGRQRDGGLGSAVVEGIRRANGIYVCVMDGDLQHPPGLVDVLVNRARQDDVDVVIASRFAGDSAASGLSPARRVVSRALTAAAKTVFPTRLRSVTDPLSGFFVVRRAAVDPDRLRPRGFKVLLEILARHPQLRVAEVDFAFGERAAGASKASPKEVGRYAAQLTRLRAASWRATPRANDAFFAYDIHGIISVTSEARLPELERFRVRHLSQPPAITVRIGDFDPRDPGVLIDLTRVTPRVRYDEVFGRRGFTVAIEAGEVTTAEVSRLITRSPHVLYTNVVEPLLRWRLVERGYALVHAAAFTVDGAAHLVTARTDTGKTTTMLKILEQGDYGFISDDLTLIDSHGSVLTYPKPLTISHHTVHALKSAELGPIETLTLPLQSRLHSRGGRQFAFKLAKMGVPVATLNTVAQMLIPPPKYHVDRLVPGVRCDRSGEVASLWIIQRGPGTSRDLEQAEAMDILLENCADAYGFPPYDTLEHLMLSASDDDLRLREREIIRAGLAGVRTRLLHSTTMGWAEDIHAAIAAPTPRGATGNARV